MKNTNTATNLQLVMIPINENIGIPIPLGSSFTGNATKAKMIISADGRFLALSYSQGNPTGWFNATTGGNEIRTYQLDTDYTTATEVGTQAIPEVADIHSMRFNADCSYMYYTASSNTDGHTLYRIETTANATPEAIADLSNYSELSTDKNGKFYAVVANTNTLKAVTHSATPQVTDITLDLPAGYTLTGAMPLQPHRIYANENIDDIYVRTLGNKQYELKDHLGNVRAVISDRKLSTLSGTFPSDFNADLLASYNYYPFGMNMPGRTYNPEEYRYGFQGQETDTETGLVNYKFRMHDPRIGRFFAVDPLAPDYPWNSPYAFSENRVIDGIELEGLEYVTVHHYFNGATAKTEFYKMTSKDIERLGGTTAGIHNSVPYGPGGKGILHYYYNENGDKFSRIWEQRQINFESDMEFHGLYSGGGSITYDGFKNSTNYNFTMQPIDWADAIAKRHDKDYAKAASENYAGYLEDIRTLQADLDMVSRIDNFLAKNWYKVTGELIGVEGVETPVRTTTSLEREGSMYAQRVLISSLATYKQWKLDNGLENKNVYKDNREAFGKAHPAVAKILDQTPASKK